MLTNACEMDFYKMVHREIVKSCQDSKKSVLHATAVYILNSCYLLVGMFDCCPVGTCLTADGRSSLKDVQLV